jgi:hypothetical protein
MSVTLIIATRHRPLELKRTLEETLPNAARVDSVVLICADEDDQETRAILPDLPKDPRLRVSVRPREDSRGEKYDRALTEAPADVYLVGHDCASITSPGWDDKVMEGFHLLPDGIGVINGPMSNASFPGLHGPTAKLVAKLGYIYNHEYPFWFVDHELDDIARIIGRGAFVECTYENRVRRPGKTLRLRHLEFWTRYFDCMTGERRQKAFAILDGGDFCAPPWLKAILKSQAQMVEARSFQINHSVRQSAKAIEAARGEEGEPDAGYLRLLRAAEDKLVRLGFAKRAAA